MRTVEIAAERPYRVRVGAGARHELGGLLEGVERVAVLHPAVLSDRVTELVAGLDARVTPVVLPDAERAKTAEVLTSCWDALAAAGFTRSDVVVGVGGGATTDLAGFVAATMLRGIGFVTVPTTVLGMVDAAVGGKTGINLPAGKNLVGAFHEPLGVLCDLELLEGLPVEDVRAGLAEVLKCGFVADPEILRLVEEDPVDAVDVTSPRLAELVSRGIEVKAGAIAGDLREATSTGGRIGRELVNYGHTFGHALERAESYRWRHGDAVSVGMVYVAELAEVVGLQPAALRDRHREVLSALGLPTRYSGAGFEELLAGMRLDKKTRGSTLRFVALEELARPVILTGPEESDLREAHRRIG
ncbi:3-dehydroquinate synthase [Auraticoccus monumenti]|uniref:3-dehydroquinate synthase n=1 Tax=Auraticoccus monumenti TaxID=675864 RepID=A0A1G7BCY6_9ACTN|nr:3-dehydroquinate synthase [Auraticoccus monumenti]SDE24206.1 3-dehydroquinate synthase [Auraticoccus monumenti]